MEEEKPKPWHQDWQQKGDEFHMMIGQCIAEWAGVDEALFQIFRDSMGAQWQQCAIVFYRLPGLEVRLGMTDEIVLSVLPKRERENGGKDHPDVARWKSIAKDFRGLLGTRRRIAHQPVHISLYQRADLATDDPNQEFATGFEIFTSIHERLRETGSVYIDDYDKPALTLSDLQAHVASIHALIARLRDFLRDVRPRPPE